MEYKTRQNEESKVLTKIKMKKGQAYRKKYQIEEKIASKQYVMRRKVKMTWIIFRDDLRFDPCSEAPRIPVEHTNMLETAAEENLLKD